MKPSRLYKQEAKAGIFQCTFPWLAMGAPMKKHLAVGYGELWGFLKDNYIFALFQEENLERIAGAVLKLSGGAFPPEWQKEWERIDAALTAASGALVSEDLEAYSLDELAVKYQTIADLHGDMWGLSIFIDSFDPGYDQKEIEKIAAEHHLDTAEVHILTTPLAPAYITEWNIALKSFSDGESSFEALQKKFFWYGVNYSEFNELTQRFVEAEMAHRHTSVFESPADAEKQILLMHSLDSNPLEFFRTLTLWRDQRKRLNYTGLYGLIKLLREVAKRHGIDASLINGMFPHQADDFFKGAVSGPQLAEQLHGGIFLEADTEGNCSFIFGKAGEERWKEMMDLYQKGSPTGELRGTIASKGKATGKVLVLADFADPKAAGFARGDILVTSMTRPEFLPLMKLAGAIVTDEGGITSHAAIVSRELGIPCIIGTRFATEALKDGDMIEVDANEGRVRIVEHKK